MNNLATHEIEADPSLELERLVQAITSLEGIVEGWDESQRLTVQALKSAIEDLHKQALKRLIRSLKDDPAARVQLAQAVTDPLV